MPMSEVELYLIQDGENCTIYTLQFLRDVESEFEKFVTNSGKMPSIVRISRVLPHLSNV